jgi:hypothetical protein
MRALNQQNTVKMRAGIGEVTSNPNLNPDLEFNR